MESIGRKSKCWKRSPTHAADEVHGGSEEPAPRVGTQQAQNGAAAGLGLAGVPSAAGVDLREGFVRQRRGEELRVKKEGMQYKRGRYSAGKRGLHSAVLAPHGPSSAELTEAHYRTPALIVADRYARWFRNADTRPTSTPELAGRSPCSSGPCLPLSQAPSRPGRRPAAERCPKGPRSHYRPLLLRLLCCCWGPAAAAWRGARLVAPPAR